MLFLNFSISFRLLLLVFLCDSSSSCTWTSPKTDNCSSLKWRRWALWRSCRRRWSRRNSEHESAVAYCRLFSFFLFHYATCVVVVVCRAHQMHTNTHSGINISMLIEIRTVLLVFYFSNLYLCKHIITHDTIHTQIFGSWTRTIMMSIKCSNM